MQHDLEFFEGFLETPPLWEGIQFGIQQFDFPSIDLHRFKSAPIPQNIRLGHQIEHVFKQLLTFDDTYEILLYNIPVRRDKTTLGEIDFLLKRRDTNQLIHVELTYKFYILDTSTANTLEQLSGANRLDLFLKKLDKIQTKQFPLLHRPEAKTILKEHNIAVDTTILHQVCFKAQLFVPYHSSGHNDITPLNSSCIIGHWLHLEQFKTGGFSPYRYYIPKKRERVLAPKASVHWEFFTPTLAQLMTYMSQEKSVLLWQRRSATDFRRFFIVWWS